MDRTYTKQWLISLDASPYRDAFVLRGGLLMDTWIPGRRSVNDLDLLALGSLEEANAAIQELCKGAEQFTIIGVEKIWQETPSPGLRYALPSLQLDVATGDPLVVPAQRTLVEDVSVLVCAPEIMYGWKTHGLFERGEGRWRARDLWDLYLLQTYLELDSETLNRAVAVAFESRNDSFAIANRFFEDDWGCSKGSQKKWMKFCQESGEKAAVIKDLLFVKQEVSSKLARIFRSICPTAFTNK